MQSICLTEEIGWGSGAALPLPLHTSPPLHLPPILSFCSISFITVSWLRDRLIVRVLDREGQQ